MLFLDTRTGDMIQRALRAAVAAHRPAVLRDLLARHGERAYARGLAGLSGRVIADALSMLPFAERGRVRQHLPRSARNRLLALERPTTTSVPARPRNPLAWRRQA